MNILLTGGCGYVGTPLTQSLLDRGHRVTVVDLQWFGNFLPAHPNLTVIREDIRHADRIPIVTFPFFSPDLLSEARARGF
jgi:nucleoside-diphosphate-sugar epimerase